MSAYIRASRDSWMASGETAMIASARRPTFQPSASWAQRQPTATTASPARTDGNRNATSPSPNTAVQPFRITV